MGRGDASATANLGQGVAQRFGSGAVVGQDARGGVRGGVARGNADEQVLGGDVLVTESLGLVGSGLESREQAAGGLRLAHRAAGGRRKLGQGAARCGADGLESAGVGIDGGEQADGDAVLLTEELGEQVKRVDAGVPAAAAACMAPEMASCERVV